MNRVKLLSENVANQIAAGEVVERPASVVKELVENALDAKASQITVEIQAGGRSLIRVTDNGIGMSKDDALMCLERHATSKITEAEDLATISTMGFRGEALPSIASVSRFSLTTKEHGQDRPEGTQIIVNGGRIVEVKAAGRASGTTVEVRQLFFNLPARRKFLRTEETERSHIQHYLTLAALAHPQVGFEFRSNQRVVWQLLPAPNDTSEPVTALLERWRSIHSGLDRLIEINALEDLPASLGDESECPSMTMRLWGLIGAPGVSRSSRENHYLFANRRPIEDRGLNHAILEGYHTALMKGKFPVCCLFLEIEPSQIDVNVHPAKRDVRFRQLRRVKAFVAESIRQGLHAFHRPETAASESISTDNEAVPLAEPVQPYHGSGEIRQPSSAALEVDSPAVDVTNSPSANTPPTSPHSIVPPEPVDLPNLGGAEKSAPQPPETKPTLAPVPKPLSGIPLRIVGVVGKLYVVLETDRGMALLDQHAAHERVLYEQMMTRLESGDAPSQKLLLPETVELNARDSQFVRSQISTLNRVGVGVREFGERTFLLDALPPFVKASDPRIFTFELIDELKAAGDTVNSIRLGEAVVAKTVCRHAVKANDHLREPEIQKLLDDLKECQMPYTCPHGRPTLIEMSYRDLEKRFGRSQ